MSMFLSLSNPTLALWRRSSFVFMTFTHGELSWYQDIYNTDNKHGIAGFIFLT